MPQATLPSSSPGHYYIFTKPNRPVVTRALFIGNLRSTDTAAQALIHSLCTAFGPLEADVQVGSPSKAYVIFQHQDHATAAYNGLRERASQLKELSDIQLDIKYSCHKLVPLPPPPPPVAFHTDGLLPGLYLYHDYISVEQEAALLEAVDQQPWVMLSKRRVQHYGHAFDYVLRKFSEKLGPLPPWVTPVSSRFCSLPGMEGTEVDQLTVNEYPPGIGLAPHIDTHSSFEGPVVILSLGSYTIMEFRNGADHRPLLLPRRSLLVLIDEARHAWQHYIPSRKTDIVPNLPDEVSIDAQRTRAAPAAMAPEYPALMRGKRTSFTFRKIRTTPCTCRWPEHCDGQNSAIPPTRLAVLQGLVPETAGAVGAAARATPAPAGNNSTQQNARAPELGQPTSSSQPPSSSQPSPSSSHPPPPHPPPLSTQSSPAPATAEAGASISNGKGASHSLNTPAAAPTSTPSQPNFSTITTTTIAPHHHHYHHHQATTASSITTITSSNAGAIAEPADPGISTHTAQPSPLNSQPTASSAPTDTAQAQRCNVGTLCSRSVCGAAHDGVGSQCVNGNKCQASISGSHAHSHSSSSAARSGGHSMFDSSRGSTCVCSAGNGAAQNGGHSAPDSSQGGSSMCAAKEGGGHGEAACCSNSGGGQGSGRANGGSHGEDRSEGHRSGSCESDPSMRGMGEGVARSKGVASSSDQGRERHGGSGGGSDQKGGSIQQQHGQDDVALRRMEEQHVHAVYDIIAQHFSATRFAIWPRVRAFIDELHPGSVVADVGCGNGKYFGVRHDIAVLGSDRSGGLVEVAARRLQPGALQVSQVARADVFQADALQLPYRTGSCDAALCIAVLHHISSEARRLQLMAELVRILRPGGRAIITVWAAEQEDPSKTLKKWHSIAPPGQQHHQPSSQTGACDAPGPLSAARSTSQHQEKGQQGSADAAAPGASHVEGPPGAGGGHRAGGDYFVPWHVPFHRAGAHAAAAQQSSSAQGVAGVAPQETPVAVDQAKQTVVYQRYYHLFVEGELEELASRLEGTSVVDSGFDKSNWLVVVQKHQTTQ